MKPDIADRLAAVVSEALASNAKAGLTKPYDLSIAIRVGLDNAGLKLVNAPIKGGRIR